MMKPINGHILIRPIKEETFIPTGETSYEEKGEVLAISQDLEEEEDWSEVKVGMIVYFDSWLVARYKDQDGNDQYLVKEGDIRAIEDVTPLPEQSL